MGAEKNITRKFNVPLIYTNFQKAHQDGADCEWFENDLLKGEFDKTTMAEISVKVYYTKELVKHHGSPRRLEAALENYFGVANQGFRNSKVRVHIKI